MKHTKNDWQTYLKGTKSQSLHQIWKRFNDIDEIKLLFFTKENLNMKTPLCTWFFQTKN